MKKLIIIVLALLYSTSAYATFPVYESTTKTQFASDTSSHDVGMPATVNSGDLLMVLFAFDRGSGSLAITVDLPAGWTEAGFHNNTTVSAAYGVWWKVADGTEDSTTVDFVTRYDGNLTNTTAASQCLRISGWDGTLGGVELTKGSYAATSAPNPPSHTATWGADDNLWIAIAEGIDDDATTTAYPTDFINGEYSVSGGGSDNGSEVASATREYSSTDTLNPGTFTFSEAEGTYTFTVVVKPSSTRFIFKNVTLRENRYDYTQDASCVGVWRFEEDTKTEQEIDVSGNDELLIQGSGTIPYVDGILGKSRDFEASETEYLTAPDGGSTDVSGANQSISIVCWVKLESDTGDYQSIIAKYNSGSNWRQYKLLYTYNGSALDDNVLYFLLSSDGSASSGCIGATDINDGEWHHLACVYDDTDQRIYIDGELDSNGADNPKAYTDGIGDEIAPFFLGTTGTGADDFFDGIIDEVAIFSRALTALEIKDIYQHGLK